jgi:hypothetical protein
MRSPPQLEHAVTAHSTINPDGFYVVPERIDVGGLNLTPAKTGLLPAMKHKSELRHLYYGGHSVVQCTRPMHSSMWIRLS